MNTYKGFSLTDKHALITGGTRGIGLAIARGFVQSGAKVTICGRKLEGLTKALKELKEHAEMVNGLTAHVGKPEECENLIEKAEARFGEIDILVNNAGTNPYFGPMVDSEDWAWEKTMDVNLKGPYRLSRMLAKKMIEQGGGSIVNIASIAGLSAAPMQGIYSVTKAGLIMLTKVMARELGSHNIRVNCICPGVIRTRLAEGLVEDGKEEAVAALKALGRIGTTEELVGAAIYFASEAASFTTGAVLQVDGGMVI
ncbi:MAG TPA: glucose 1-dehydrogenase [Verrucomicrobia bacterium]|jgi:NAD(P)-dependent dehydrogenase (short-subunit alcohol dehydrogenase family)|nr:glucose 1-dehydrogenase [Verrucomicrobiota bacterium]